MQYLKEPMFWFAVVVVALAVNFAYNYFTKKGKLI
jgi:hypothetical protein